MLRPRPTSVKLAESLKDKASTSAHSSTSTLLPQSPPTPPKGKTTFLSLPSELRNQIYELALVRDRVIYINRRKHRGQPVGWDLVSPTNNPRHIASINIEEDLSRSLLSIGNVQIESEASSIFHGMNHFSVDIEHLTDFFDETSIRHVRHLQITRSNKWRDGLQKLEKWARADLLQVQKLEFSFEDFARPAGIRNAGKWNAVLLWPLVKTLVDIRGREALDLVEFFCETYRFGLNGKAIPDDYYRLDRDLAEKHNMAVREELLKIWEEEASK